MPFDVYKLAQASAVLLRAEPRHEMSYLRLLKLLYIADRESIAETGDAITGDRVVAMDQGPVLSNLYDIIKGIHITSTEWNRFIERQQYRIALVKDPGNGLLCPYEIEKLEQVSADHAHLNDWEIVNQTHDFPEWKRHYVPGTSCPIPVKDILGAVGYSEPDIQAICAEHKAMEAVKAHIERSGGATRRNLHLGSDSDTQPPLHDPF